MSDNKDPKIPYLPPSQLPGASVRQTQETPALNASFAAPTENRLFIGLGIFVVALLALVGVIALTTTILSNGDNDPESLNNNAVAVQTTDIPQNGNDSDDDGIADADDNCILLVNSDQADSDNDGTGDICDSDQDGDGINNDDDNCVMVSNPDQANNDVDEQGDACDTDDDNDTIADTDDNCILIANFDQLDLDLDGVGDACDSSVALTGLTINVSNTTYIGAVDPTILSFSPDSETAETLEVTASTGSLVQLERECLNAIDTTLMIPASVRSVKYCPDNETTEVQITAREMDANGELVAGGQTSFLYTEASLTFTLAQMVVNNDDCDWSDDALFTSELQSQMMAFSVQVSANDVSESQIYDILTLFPSGTLLVAQRGSSNCELVTNEPISDNTAFEMMTNTDLLFYFTPDDNRTNTITFDVLQHAATQSFDLLPLLVPQTNLNARNDAGGVETSLSTFEQAIVRGRGGVGANEWLQIDVDEQLLWVNIGNLVGSYEIIGVLDDVPDVELPAVFQVSDG